jgi:hypothetical protein
MGPASNLESGSSIFDKGRRAARPAIHVFRQPSGGSPQQAHAQSIPSQCVTTVTVAQHGLWYFRPICRSCPARRPYVGLAQLLRNQRRGPAQGRRLVGQAARKGKVASRLQIDGRCRADIKATGRSGYATVCKTVYPGSIPGVASSFPTKQTHVARMQRSEMRDLHSGFRFAPPRTTQLCRFGHTARKSTCS